MRRVVAWFVGILNEHFRQRFRLETLQQLGGGLLAVRIHPHIERAVQLTEKPRAGSSICIEDT